jgi:ribonuclease Z
MSEFRAREAFRRRDMSPISLAPRLLVDDEDFRVAGAVLDHGIPCLAFAFEEKLRVNVWSEGLKQLKLPVGPWLNEAKRAIRRGEPDDTLITVKSDLSLQLGVLKQYALRTARGQKFAYVVDASYHKQNIEKIRALVQGADQLFYRDTIS